MKENKHIMNIKKINFEDFKQQFLDIRYIHQKIMDLIELEERYIQFAFYDIWEITDNDRAETCGTIENDVLSLYSDLDMTFKELKEPATIIENKYNKIFDKFRNLRFEEFTKEQIEHENN